MTARSLGRVGLAFACAALAATGTARASPRAGRPAVRLVVDPCLGIASDEVRRIVAVELRALLTSAEPDDRATTTTRAFASCRETVVALRVEDPVTGKALERGVDVHLADPSTHARLVALAIVELVAASWSELETNPRPAVPPVERRAPAEEQVLAREAVEERRPPPPFRLVTSAAAVRVLSGPSLWGVGLRLGHEAGWLGLAVELAGVRGGTATSLGRVTTEAVVVGASAFVRRAFGDLALRAGGGLRGGVVRMNGDPTNALQAAGEALVAPWGGPEVGGGATWSLTRRVLVELAAQVGYVALPVRGDVGEVEDVRLEGPWLAVQLGVGVAL
jgi:hypothetical protein